MRTSNIFILIAGGIPEYYRILVLSLMIIISLKKLNEMADNYSLYLKRWTIIHSIQIKCVRIIWTYLKLVQNKETLSKERVFTKNKLSRYDIGIYKKIFQEVQLIKKLNTKDAFLNLFLNFTVGYFNRSFVGLKIFNYRIGEFIVLIGFLISIYIFITGNTFINDRKILTYFRLIIITFLLSSIFSNSSFLNTYTYKSSSYVWTVGDIFLGIYIANSISKKSNYFFYCLYGGFI